MEYKYNPFTRKLDLILSEAELDLLYLRLDATNDPVTGDLALNENLTLKDNKQLRLGDDGATDSYISFDGTNQLLYSSGDFILVGGNTIRGPDDEGGPSTGAKLYLGRGNGSQGGNAYLYAGDGSGDAPIPKLYLGDDGDGIPNGEVWLYKTTPLHWGDYNANSARIYHDGDDLIVDARWTGTGGTLLFPTGIDIEGNLNFTQVPDTTTAQKDAFTVTAGIGGTLSAGEYHYDVYFICDEGETASIRQIFGTLAVPSDTCLANGKFTLTNIPVSTDRRVTSRGIMRNEAGESAVLCQLIHTIDDNTTTTYVDDGDAPGTGEINYLKPNTSAGRITVDNNDVFRVDNYNLFAGWGAGESSDGLTTCVGLGRYALQKATTASNCTAIGVLALGLLTTGTDNTAGGLNSLYNLTTGKNNSAWGSLTTGLGGSTGDNDFMCLFGYSAGYQGPGSGQDGTVRIGYRAGAYLSGYNDVIIGRYTGYPGTTRRTGCFNNILIGAYTCTTITDGFNDNLFIGYDLEPDDTGGAYQMNLGGLIKGDMTSGSEYLWLPFDKPFYFGAGKDMSIDYITDTGNIRTDLIAPSDLNVDCGTDKTIVLEESVYEDLYIGFTGAKLPAANIPTWATFDTSLKAYTFAVNDYMYINSSEMMHGYKEGTDVEIHIHWASNGTDVDNRTVKWEVIYDWADMNEAFAGEATATAETIIPTATNVDKTHYYTSIVTVSGSGYKIGAVGLARVRRIVSTGTEPTGDPFGLQLGIHYEVDTIGSRQISTK